MSAVTPTRTGVTVRLAIPPSASGRTTVYVYGPDGDYWYVYTTGKGKVANLKIKQSLRPGTSYTFTVTNSRKQVDAGSFTTLP